MFVSISDEAEGSQAYSSVGTFWIRLLLKDFLSHISGGTTLFWK
jgi:hypothetical protein